MTKTSAISARHGANLGLWYVALVSLSLLCLSTTVLARPLSLDQARDLALASDEQLAQARQAVDGAAADVLAAGADRLPQLSLAGTYTHNLKKPVMFLPADMASAFGGATSLEMGGDWDLQAAATLSLNLWTAGRLSAARGMAGEALASSRWQEALVADAVAFAAEQAYYDALLTAEQVDIAVRAHELAEEARRVAQAALDQGTGSRFDLLRAQVELANREAPVVQARNQYHLAVLQLLRVCGLDHGESVELTDALANVPAPRDLDVLLADMIADSPELKALEHQVKAATMAVSLARAGRGPLVQLQGQYAIQGQWDDDLFPGDNETAGSATAALAVSMPVFDGFAAKAEIGGSRADLRMAELELERITRDRELGVRQARTGLVNARLSLEGRREAVTLAEEAYRLAQVRLDNGLATPLERLDAETALTDARVQLAEALYNCNLAAASLKLAVGGAHPINASGEEIQR